MINKIESHKSMAITALKFLWKFSILALQVIASFASDEPTKRRYTAGKAQQLYEEDSISGTEFSKHIHGE